eukprot:COSAG06_NODE_32831_length_499_cov_1.272500_2_plen_27_part_01
MAVQTDERQKKMHKCEGDHKPPDDSNA